MSLLEKQKELEDRAVARGEKTFQKRLRSAEEKGYQTMVGAIRRLFQEAVGPLTEYLEEWIEYQYSSPGRRHTALKWVERYGEDKTALVVSRVILDRLETKRPVKKVATKIVDTLLRELRAERLRDLAPGLFEYKIKSFEGSSYAHMARSMDAAVRHGLCDDCYEQEKDNCPHLDNGELRLPFQEKLKIGYKLVDAFIEATGMVSREDAKVVVKGKPNRQTLIVPTEKVSEWVEARNEVLGAMQPTPLPMVLPPLKWGPDKDGGYYYALKGEFPFVRGSRKHRAWVNESATGKVEYAVNRIQETPWRVNERVLEVLEWVVGRGGDAAGLPPLEAEEIPEKPDDIDTNEEARKEWRTKAARVRDRNATILGAARPVMDAAWIARDLAEEEAIWFPHSLDFRGRVYPIVSILSPQGPDHHKGVLQFADGAPLGKRGAWWLAIHGANCLGEWQETKTSKLRLQERVDLIERLTPMILEVAEDPYGHNWWWDADEPFQFLAFAFDWAGYQEEGEDYVSYLPVAMDGSNNGLQHLSAMVRDEVGAEAVNVRNNDEPRDVYLEVAEKVLDNLEARAPDSKLARLWLTSSLVDRKITKRPVMTFPYGSKVYGFTDQIYEELKGRDNWADIEEHFSEVDEETGEIKNLVHPAFTYLSQRIWEALQTTTVAAIEVMEWLQKVSRYISKTGKAPKWVTPGTDFPVIQDSWRYYKQESKRIETILAGKVVRPRYYEKKDKIDTRKQANAISPNFVHSLDAAVLMLTVLQADQDGVEHFAMVHDSYGTLAADAEILFRATREVFYDFYRQHDVLEEFYYQALDQVPVEDMMELPEPPGFGDLNLEEVLFSDYFFA